MMMLSRIGSLVHILLSVFSNADKLWVRTQPKVLTFPMGLGNKLQIISGFGVPVELKDTSLTYGLILKTNYALPTNTTFFGPPTADQRGTRISRWSLYATIETALKRLSFGGNNCLLRTICEAAETPLQDNGLIGEILHVLLTPSSTDEECDDTEMMNIYHHAEQSGRKQSEKCHEIFPECSISLLDIISHVIEETS